MTIQELMRAAAAWLNRAADELDAGDVAAARDCLRLCQLGVNSLTLKRWLESDSH